MARLLGMGAGRYTGTGTGPGKRAGQELWLGHPAEGALAEHRQSALQDLAGPLAAEAERASEFLDLLGFLAVEAVVLN